MLKLLNYLTPVFLKVTVQDSTIYKGTVSLINDVSSALLIILPLSAAAILAYLAVRKMGAEEQETPVWKKRMWGVGIAFIVGITASGIVSLVSGYYV